MARRSEERMIESGAARICAQVFGEPEDPGILLIGGAASTMDSWEDGFCIALASAGRQVIRYDLRDTGRSSHSPVGAPDYTGADLCADALAVLDACEIGSAHLVGISLGGGLAQRIALDHPDRVASLTLIATGPAVDGPEDRPELPEPDLDDLEAGGVDWSDREAAITAMVAGERAFSGPRFFKEERVREAAERAYDRTADMAACQTNHWMLSGAPQHGERLADIDAPTLVIHGTADPLFAPAYAEVLADEIPNARLVMIDGLGHQYPPKPLREQIAGEIIALQDQTLPTSDRQEAAEGADDDDSGLEAGDVDGGGDDGLDADAGSDDRGEAVVEE